MSIGPKDKVKLLYSDNSNEIEVACNTLSPTHDGSLFEHPQSNGAAEQAVRRSVEGTRRLLAQSGLSLRYLRQVAVCIACSRNLFDVVHSGLYKGKIPYEGRFEISFEGKRVCFGKEIKLLPSQKDLVQDAHLFAPKLRKCIFSRICDNFWWSPG